MTTIRSLEDFTMSEVEKLQKKVIELQEAELIRLRMEVNQLRFELSKIQASSPPITTVPNVAPNIISPDWTLRTPYTWITTTSDNTHPPSDDINKK
jgi:hypothetical protein